MLSGSRILATDPATGRVAPINTVAPLRSSTGLGWSSLHLEEHRVPADAARTLLLHDDLLCVQLTPSFVYQEPNGAGWVTRRSPAGTVAVRPRASRLERRWSGEFHGVLVAVSAALLASAARRAGVAAPPLGETTGPDAVVQHLVLALRAEVEHGGPAGRLYADSIGLALALHVVRHYAAPASRAPAPPGGLARPALRRVLDLVTSRPEDNHSLAGLAAIAGLSPFHFARAFRRSLGLSPHQFVLRTRVERAKALLAEQRLSLVEVGLASGFASQSHFTSVFRRLVGTTPQRYRAGA
jgi:AraC family transcriptional regulator